MMPYDVVTLGETMLRLTPLGMRRLEQAASLEIEVGGVSHGSAGWCMAGTGALLGGGIGCTEVQHSWGCPYR
jgi:hypothetical protein